MKAWPSYEHQFLTVNAEKHLESPTHKNSVPKTSNQKLQGSKTCNMISLMIKNEKYHIHRIISLKTHNFCMRKSYDTSKETKIISKILGNPNVEHWN